MPARVRWRGLELPLQVRAVQDSLTDRYGEFVAEPFERGYGHTVGNSLRRVMLSSLEGAAVVAVKIEGAQQEFSALEGVKEDVAEIVLNIKELVLKLHPDAERVLKIETKKTERILNIFRTADLVLDQFEDVGGDAAVDGYRMAGSGLEGKAAAQV